jgi:hypothetical protein
MTIAACHSILRSHIASTIQIFARWLARLQNLTPTLNSNQRGFVMSDYCLLPDECQKNEAAYMANQYGIDYGMRYLAVVTNPKPTPTSKKSSGRFTGNRELPQIKYVQLKKVFDVSQG